MLTPLLPISYGYSRPYNYVELPVPEQTERAKAQKKKNMRKTGQMHSNMESCGENNGENFEETFYSIKDATPRKRPPGILLFFVTGEWESCVIYTPAAYEEETDKTFPVLYLQHGHGENETGWTTSGKPSIHPR